jgi:hypothetical protein
MGQTLPLPDSRPHEAPEVEVMLARTDDLAEPGTARRTGLEHSSPAPLTDLAGAGLSDGVSSAHRLHGTASRLPPA